MQGLLLGPPGLGKTPAAAAMCSVVATAEQAHGNAFFLKVGTLDCLRVAVAAGLMVPGVPVLCDEVTPGATKGSRAASSLEELKKCTNVAYTDTVDARNSDITFAAGQARIFTSNASSLQAWHPALPAAAEAMSPAERLSLDPSVRAVFKRVVWARVDVPLVPSLRAERFWEDRTAAASRKVARVLGMTSPHRSTTE